MASSDEEEEEEYEDEGYSDLQRMYSNFESAYEDDEVNQPPSSDSWPSDMYSDSLDDDEGWSDSSLDM
ncbi:UNVERIFIED_CONTAM: hypothetical protein Sradi_0718300 [Sesamum radiatum]|uniref:Uncharacterized protein n=1 Tax=Sesamum radiatum TaxID=300843 RepID=A0AAW2VNW2_SESRA